MSIMRIIVIMLVFGVLKSCTEGRECMQVAKMVHKKTQTSISYNIVTTKQKQPKKKKRKWQQLTYN